MKKALIVSLVGIAMATPVFADSTNVLVNAAKKAAVDTAVSVINNNVANNTPVKSIVSMSDVMDVQAQITAVDAKNNTVTLQSGNTTAVVTPSKYVNVNDLKVGDNVTAMVEVDAVLDLRKGDGIAVTQVATAATPKGKTVGAMINTVANVDVVNKAAKTITLTNGDGKSFRLKVKDPSLLKMIKVGDQVQATMTITRLVSISVPTSN